MTERPPPESGPIPLLRVVVGDSPAERRGFVFQQPFRIGRAQDCEVSIQSEFVSRVHAGVTFANGQWWVVDSGSVNGLFVNSERVAQAPVAPLLILRLGVEGPFVWLRVEEPAAVPAAPPAAAPPAADSPDIDRTQAVVEKYFGDPVEGESVGEHTMRLRHAYRHVQKRQRRRYGKIIAALGVLIVGIAGFAAYQFQQTRQQRAVAQDLFYAMKSLDVDIGALEKLVLDSGQGAEQIQKYRARRQDLERSYDRFISSLDVYDPKMKEPERLLLRIARVFGECELTMPPDFAAEVETYIKKWQSSGRFARAIRTAQEKGYTAKIADELLARGLPPQFFYLAMQESDFDAFASGPPTYKGIAKGMWQFIPETAVKYDLKLGPLIDLRRPDPGDDRHHWEKETRAAVRYLKDLYTSDAQASGLLVMASYNWGEHRVIPLIQSLAANPRERNYWKLLAAYRDKIPKETYDYVFYIVAAAVIGENPRLFGFDFDNPLGHLEQK